MHMYIVGQTGVGKSTLIEMLAAQDLLASRGFALFDPHGDLVQRVRSNVPPSSRSHISYLDATDPQQLYGYNPLRRVPDAKISLAASGPLEALRKLWPDAWGVRMEHVLPNSLYALVEQDSSRLRDILRLYGSKEFQGANRGRQRPHSW